MRITFRGAARQVTGSQYLVEAAGARFLVDCGLNQGPDDRGEQNRQPFGFEPERLDFLLLSHAHLDHCGLIGRLHREGFHGPVYCTPPTMDLAGIVMLDSAKIQEEDTRFELRRWKRHRLPGPPPEPLYIISDAQAALRLFQPCEYDQEVPLGAGLSCSFLDAGHILGASTLVVNVEENGARRRVVFSGDLGQADRPLMRDPQIPHDADVVLMEGTYGDRNREPREQSVETFRQRLVACLERGGHAIIPAFAIDRTQEVLYTLSRLGRAGQLPPAPIFVDSPMGQRATAVFERYAGYLDEAAEAMMSQGRSPFNFPGLEVLRSVQESQRLNDLEGPFVVISSSGMCSGGRIRHHLHHHLEHPDDELLFVGYQAEDTPGRALVEGAKELTIFEQPHRVLCHVTYLEGFSAHADQQSLTDWAEQVTAPGGKLFLTHGEEPALQILATLLRARMTAEVVVPDKGESFEV